MAVFQVKKYKVIKDENGNKIQVNKTKEEWNRETKNGSMTWYFSTRYKISDKTKQYKSKLFALKREAEEQERLFLIDSISYIKEHSKRAKIDVIEDSSYNLEMNLDNYFTMFINYKLNYIKESSIYRYKTDWKDHLKPIFGKLYPKDITFALIQKWHENANKKINPRTETFYAIKTKNSWHNTLTEFLKYLFSHNLIDMNYSKIIGGFKKPNENKNQKKEIRYQTIEEFTLFMSVVDDPFWYAFFNFLFWHGCRKGEQRALKIKDVSLNNNTIHFQSTFTRDKNGSEKIGSIKNGKERTIYLASQSKDFIQKLINFYKQMEGYSDNWYLFGGPFNTNKNRIERALRKYYAILRESYPSKSIKEFSHHEFGRHSHASYLLEEGLNKGLSSEEIYALIAQRLGDSVDVIKQVYAHPYEDSNNEKVKKILN